VLHAVCPAQDHPPDTKLLPLPRLLEIEDRRVAHAFIGEPLVPFVAGSRRKGLGQEVLDWLLGRTPRLPTQRDEVRPPQCCEEVLHKVQLGTRERAALTVSLAGGAALIGRVGIGYLLNRFFAPSVAVWFFCGFALGLFLLWSEAVGGLVSLAVVLVGLGVGAELDFMPYAVSRYFGLRAFGEIYSYTFAIFTLGGVVGPLPRGAGFGAPGLYSLVLVTFVMAALTATALMTRLEPYRIWEPAAALAGLYPFASSLKAKRQVV
jgi:MFS family permease